MNKNLYSCIAILIVIFVSACASPVTPPANTPDIRTNPATENIFPTIEPVTSPSSDPGTSVPAATDQSPPPATLTINGITQTSGVGTYCWNFKTGNGESVDACADKIGIPTAIDPLKAASPVKGQLTLPLSDPPSQLVLTAYHALPTLELSEKTGGYRWWNFTEGYISPLSLETSQEINIKLDRGLYVFYVFAVWDGKGDVSYGFLVNVK